MATPWELLKRAAQVEFQLEYTRLTEDAWNELLVQSIMDYSRDVPILKKTTLNLVSSTSDVDLPLDFVRLEEILGASGLLQEQHLYLDWAVGRAYETGSWLEYGRQFLRFRSPMDGTVTLWYWGFHASDGSTLNLRDIPRIKLLVFSNACSSLIAKTASRGRVQAGPVSWDDGAIARVYDVKGAAYRQDYERLVRGRAYGTRSGGADFNMRERVIDGAGEWLGQGTGVAWIAWSGQG